MDGQLVLPGLDLDQLHQSSFSVRTVKICTIIEAFQVLSYMTLSANLLEVNSTCNEWRERLFRKP